ncbi:hypothetical protein VNI00_005679 [Paramarasmius palmivorus]|uniref:Uncharacterized protein n=1 Tax=Paramarasmius palmivorus TaxID=297713 RepID=A0AAW0DBD5_9AGAR
MQTSGTLPIDNAIAVLVVPPVSRNPATKQRPQASMSSHPPMEEAEKSPTNAPNRTMSTLYPTTTTESSQMSETLPTHQIPLYHGALAFPESSQRAALYELLSKILGVERNARYKAKMNTPESRSRKGENKYSHAFVLMSDENTIQFADTAAVALALWRLRMFEGMGWEGRVGWIKRYNHRSLLDFE